MFDGRPVSAEFQVAPPSRLLNTPSPQAYMVCGAVGSITIASIGEGKEPVAMKFLPPSMLFSTPAPAPTYSTAALAGSTANGVLLVSGTSSMGGLDKDFQVRPESVENTSEVPGLAVCDGCRSGRSNEVVVPVT